MQDYHEFMKTCSLEQLQDNILANEEFRTFLQEKPHWFRQKQDELCHLAVEQDTTKELGCLFLWLGEENWRHLVNANYVINRAMTRRKFNVLRYMADRCGMPEAASFKTGCRNLELLAFLHNLNTHWFDVTYEVAKYNNWTDVMEFMVNNGYTVPVPKPVREGDYACDPVSVRLMSQITESNSLDQKSAEESLASSIQT